MNLITNIKPGLYIGGADHVLFESEEFDKLGINVIINCSNEIDHEPIDGCIIEQYPIDDDAMDESFANQVDIIADRINYYLLKGSNIYVHCVQGISRSAAVIIYYLMKYEKSSFDKAYNRLFVIRPCISPHINFVKELKKRDMYKSENDGFKNRFSDL